MGKGKQKTVNSPVPGRVVEIKTEAGAGVKRGDLLLIVEAMKMYNRILAPMDGVVKEVFASAGQNVRTSDPLVIVEAE